MGFRVATAVVAVLLLATPSLAQVEPDPAPAREPADGTAKLRSVLEQGAARFETGPFDLTLHGRLNAWGGWVGDDALLSEGDRMQRPGFRMRRVRLGVDGHFAKPLTYRIELDVFDQEKTGGPLYEAWVDWTPLRWVGATVGFQKFPFVRTQMNSSARLSHLDRAVAASAMSPTNSLGVVLHSEPWEGHLTVSAGVFNGLERRPGFFQGYQPVGVSEGNRFERLAYVARVDVAPLEPVGPGEPDLDRLPRFRLGFGGSFLFNDGDSIRTLGASGYAVMKCHGFHLMGEAIWDRSKPREDPTTTNTIGSEVSRLAAHGSLGYVILRDLLGVSARVEYLDGNMDLDDESDQLVVAGTVSYYAIGHFLKVQAEYQHRRELHGLQVANDAVLAGVQAYF